MSNQLHSRTAEDLRNAIAALPRGPRRRYPPQLRSHIVNYVDTRTGNGAGRKDVASEINVSVASLRYLVKRERKQNANVGHGAVKIKRVAIINKRQPAETLRQIVVRGPHGIVIEGIEIPQLVELFKALA